MRRAHHVLGANVPATELCSFLSNDNAQRATYEKAIDVYARVEFRSMRREANLAPVSIPRCVHVHKYCSSNTFLQDFVGTIINGLLKVEEVGFGDADKWNKASGSALHPDAEYGWD